MYATTLPPLPFSLDDKYLTYQGHFLHMKFVIPYCVRSSTKSILDPTPSQSLATFKERNKPQSMGPCP